MLEEIFKKHHRYEPIPPEDVCVGEKKFTISPPPGITGETYEYVISWHSHTTEMDILDYLLNYGATLVHELYSASPAPVPLYKISRAFYEDEVGPEDLLRIPKVLLKEKPFTTFTINNWRTVAWVSQVNQEAVQALIERRWKKITLCAPSRNWKYTFLAKNEDSLNQKIEKAISDFAKSEWKEVLLRKHAAEYQVLHCCKPVISEIY